VNISSTISRIAAVLATVTALTALAGVAQAGTSRPPSIPKAEYRALMLRSEALNRTHHLGSSSRIRIGMTGAEYRAVMLRSEGLNKKYGLGQWKTAAAAAEPASAAGGFSWTAFGIGAAAGAGLLFLLAGAVVVRRSGQRVPRARISS
jgi:hypothetical protein